VLWANESTTDYGGTRGNQRVHAGKGLGKKRNRWSSNTIYFFLGACGEDLKNPRPATLQKVSGEGGDKTKDSPEKNLLCWANPGSKLVLRLLEGQTTRRPGVNKKCIFGNIDKVEGMMAANGPVRRNVRNSVTGSQEVKTKWKHS